MSWLMIFKLGFFLTWPALLIGAIIYSKKMRKNPGKGRSLWHH